MHPTIQVPLQASASEAFIRLERDAAFRPSTAAPALPPTAAGTLKATPIDWTLRLTHFGLVALLGGAFCMAAVRSITAFRSSWERTGAIAASSKPAHEARTQTTTINLRTQH